jgi:signal transduction histidine kinase
MYRIIAIVLLYLSCSYIHIMAATDDAGINQKSLILQQKLARAEGKERLHTLQQLSVLYWDVPKEEYWLKRLYVESMEMKNYSLAESAIAELSRYYHNVDKPLQSQWCAKVIDRLAAIRGEYSEYYFIVKTFLCERYLWNNDYGKAVYETNMLLDLSIKCHNRAGEELCDELMGLIFQMRGRDEKALHYFSIAYNVMEKYLANRQIGARSQLITVLIETNLKLGHLDAAYRFIRKFEKIQYDVKKGKYKDADNYPVERNLKLVNVYDANYYLQKGDMRRAKICIDNAKRLKESDVYVDFLLHYEEAKYADKKGSYNDALLYINKVIETDGGETVEYRKFRAETYTKLDMKQQALDEFRQCLKMQQDSSVVIFDREVAQLQHMQETKMLEMRYKDNELRMRKNMIFILFAIVLFLITTAVILCLSLKRNKKLRFMLSKNNEELIKSETLLKSALNKANEVDKLKNSFLHSISHEIRTPLNSIVGFSTIIANEPHLEEDERVKYSGIVKKNNDDLLDAVNKMMELSDYQSSVNLSPEELAPRDIEAECLELANSLKDSGKLNPSVKVLLDCKPHHFILCTNARRLDELIMNLLVNAAKYTQKGSIVLSYRTIEDGRYIQFSVTDTGCGIKEDVRDTIFDLFEKGGSLVQGIGLGLSLCRVLADAFGGTIYLDKDYKDGCRFVFTHSTAFQA